MLSLYKLEIFYTVAQESNFSRAAEHLYMTQAAVSQHIHDLEIALGAQLFVRKPAGVQLTGEGVRLLGYTKKILKLVAQAESELTQVAKLPHGSLIIGALPYAAALILPLWIQPFIQTYPQLTLSVQPEPSKVIIDKVADGLLDLGFVDSPIEDFQLVCTELPGCEVGIVVSQNNPWSRRESVSIQELNNQPFVTCPARHYGNLWTNQLFNRLDISPRIIAELDDIQKILDAVQQQSAVTLLPRCIIQGRNEYSYISLNDVNDMNKSLFLVTPADMPISAIARSLLTQMSLYFPNLYQILAGSSE
jgi:DNA-binding transcriptional LysR family regulator